MHEEKKVTWTELFFDLVFVAAANELATILKGTHNLFEALPFLLLFIPILWVWVGHTLFSTQFEGTSWIYHIFTLFTMGAVLSLVVHLDKAFLSPFGFAISYAAAKGILILLYVFKMFTRPNMFASLWPLLLGYLISGFLWVYSVNMPYPYIFWVVAFLIDLLTPLMAARHLEQVTISTTHLPERMGLLTVIMLGEMIISMVYSVHGVELTMPIWYMLIAGLATITMIFWSYFRFTENYLVGSNQSLRNNWYLYGHLFMYISLIGLAAGFKGVMLGKHTEWLILFGIILFVFSFRTLKYIRDQRVLKRQMIMLVFFLPALFLYQFVTESVLMNVAILSGALILYLFITEILLTRYHKHRDKQMDSSFVMLK
jgi:low temperature requirement protein LtrA